VGAGEWADHHAITSLMYRYAEYVDAANFDGIGALFARGEITTPGVPGAIVGADAVAAMYRGSNKVHPNGTLMTRHLTTNVLVDIADDATSATVRSSFVVFQATPATALQPIVAGRYHDRFDRHDDGWWFGQREMRVEQVGDVSDHLLMDLGKFTSR
jgi:3-phenylpropionate/cinnamic acid dioxygenase small subunit